MSEFLGDVGGVADFMAFKVLYGLARTLVERAVIILVAMYFHEMECNVNGFIPRLISIGE